MGKKPRRQAPVSLDWSGVIQTPLGPIALSLTHAQGQTHIAARQVSQEPAVSDLKVRRDQLLDELNALNERIQKQEHHDADAEH